MNSLSLWGVYETVWLFKNVVWWIVCLVLYVEFGGARYVYFAWFLLIYKFTCRSRRVHMGVWADHYLLNYVVSRVWGSLVKIFLVILVDILSK